MIASGPCHDAFLAALRKRLDQNPPLDRYRQSDWEGARRAAQQAVEAGGAWLDPAMADLDAQRALVVTGAPTDGPLARGEHFGPALAVIRADDDAAACATHRGFDQHLATALFTQSLGRAAKLCEPAALADLGGVVTVNDCVIPSAHPAAPLSGRGPSGWGVSRGVLGLQAMTRPVVVSRTRRWLRTPLRPPSETTKRWILAYLDWRYG